MGNRHDAVLMPSEVSSRVGHSIGLPACRRRS